MLKTPKIYSSSFKGSKEYIKSQILQELEEDLRNDIKFENNKQKLQRTQTTTPNICMKPKE